MAKILVIEDDQYIRANLRRLLQLEGHEVIEAEDGARGIEAALGERPQLIICDVMMPRVDGFAVLRAVRAHPDTRGVGFCFLAARAESAMREAGLAQGADEYLTKPFDLEGLRRAIAQMLAVRPAQ